MLILKREDIPDLQRDLQSRYAAGKSRFEKVEKMTEHGLILPVFRKAFALDDSLPYHYDREVQINYNDSFSGDNSTRRFVDVILTNTHIMEYKRRGTFDNEYHLDDAISQVQEYHYWMRTRPDSNISELYSVTDGAIYVTWRLGEQLIKTNFLESDPSEIYRHLDIIGADLNLDIRTEIKPERPITYGDLVKSSLQPKSIRDSLHNEVFRILLDIQNKTPEDIKSVIRQKAAPVALIYPFMGNTFDIVTDADELLQKFIKRFNYRTFGRNTDSYLTVDDALRMFNGRVGIDFFHDVIQYFCDNKLRGIDDPWHTVFATDEIAVLVPDLKK